MVSAQLLLRTRPGALWSVCHLTGRWGWHSAGDSSEHVRVQLPAVGPWRPQSPRLCNGCPAPDPHGDSTRDTCGRAFRHSELCGLSQQDYGVGPRAWDHFLLLRGGAGRGLCPSQGLEAWGRVLQPHPVPTQPSTRNPPQSRRGQRVWCVREWGCSSVYGVVVRGP